MNRLGRSRSATQGLANSLPTLLVMAVLLWTGCKKLQESAPTYLPAPQSRYLTDSSLLKWIQLNPELETLDLFESEVSDAGLAHLSRLRRLKDLDLRACENVTDAGIQHLRQIRTLKTLSVSGRGISESGYRFLANLPGLDEFKVSGGVFARLGLGFLKGSANIREIDLMPIHLNPDDLKHLEGYPSLKRLRIGSMKQSSDTLIAPLHYLGMVKSLEYLDLSGCELNDDGVEFLKELPNLETLILANNELTSRVFSLLSQAKKLKVLDVGMNQISAPLDAISGLTSLRRLDLSRNHGIVDDDLEPLLPLNALEELSLKRTSITGSGLRYLPNLKSLDASFAALTDDALAEISKLSTLEVALIDGNRGLSDSGLANLAKLPRLTTLSANGLNSTGSCFRHFRPDSQLTDLSIAGWKIDDGTVAILSSIQNLSSLNLAGTKLSDEGLAFLARLPRLRKLNISGTPITAAGLDPLSKMATLESLFLARTGISDAGQRTLEFPRSLTHLDLEGSRIGDGQLAAIGELAELKELNLVQTEISDEGLARLTGLTKLETVYLDRTNVSISGVETLLGIQSVRTVKNSIFHSFSDSEVAKLRSKAPFACFQKLYLLPPGF